MTDKEKKYLSDILTSLHHIQSFTIDIQSFEDYKKNFLVKSGVERNLTIVGEAVAKFLKERGENKLPNAVQIVSVRNRLVHTYDNIDDRLIWAIVKRHLPVLQ